MLNDAADTNPPPESPDQTPPDPHDPAPTSGRLVLVMEPGTMNGRMALIRALARILARLDSTALAVSQSSATTAPDESHGSE